MASDIILKEREVKVTGGDLKVDKGLELGTTFASNRSRLKFDLNGLTIRDNDETLTLRPGRIFSPKGHFTDLNTSNFLASAITLGKGNAGEPRDPGTIEIENGKGQQTIALEGQQGKIECKDIKLDTINSLVQVIRQLQDDIRLLKNR
jgi:hypothetical protein